MRKPSQIQIDIAKPCGEDWSKMTPCEQGRYCGRCKKRVIDFTAWSDAALYNFFAGRPQNVCGRLLVSQTQRAIHIPQQPHSRLYRMVVAMGLCLLAAQPLNAQTRPPMKGDTILVMQPAQDGQRELATGGLRGRVLDDKKEPLLSATIHVLQNGKLMGGNVTDFDGEYVVALLAPGYYDVLCSYIGYDSMMITKVVVQPGSVTAQSFSMQRQEAYEPMVIVAGGIGYSGGSASYFGTPERISDKKLKREKERKERKAARKKKRNKGSL